jgi:uncharacterized protein (TIRG00374 family)
MRSSAVSTWAKVLATFGISILFFYLFVRDLNFEQVWESIKDADYELVPLALLFFAASLVARTFRWRRFYSPNAPSTELLGSTLVITYAANNLLPLRGGELLRAQLLFDRAGVSRMRTFGVALVERFFDLLIVGTFVIAGETVTDVGVAFLGTGLIVTAGGAVGLVIARLTVANRHLPEQITAISWLPLKDAWRQKLRNWGEWLVDGFAVLKTWTGVLACLGWTVVAWMLEFTMYWIVAQAFHIDEQFLTIAFVGAAANLALSIPSAQGGVGPFQLVAKEALLKFGVATNTAGAYALALHVLIVAPVTVVGLLVFLTSVPRYRAVLRAAAESETTGTVA